MAQYIKTEEGYKEFSIVTEDKMDKTDPTGTGSFSMNRKAGTVIGAKSHAEGNNTTASKAYSHAEGDSTRASGIVSHAEGFYTTASGDYSHAEGYWTKASGVHSHAEGYQTTASGSYSHAEGNNTTASGQSSHAEGASTNKFSSVVTTTNPTIEDIINVWKNKKFSVAKGVYSHVEGRDSLALNDCSHAEGNITTASGKHSHAEGSSTEASGDHSHTEGANTTASGLCSHAEGNITTASGTGSHVEGGSTKAIGDYSHAEGYGTEASGSYSHAEGRRTKASGDNSHAQGKFNIEDTSNTYADIIGNGTSDTARSNAATVDWEGNAWFAGDVYTCSTSGTNKDNGSKKLATEEYVDNSIAVGGTDISLGLTSASVGQTIKVKAVDESGKPTEWEAADISAGGGWELITDITLTEDGGGAGEIYVSRNDKGEDFEYRQCMVCLSGKVIDGWPKGAYIVLNLYESNELTGSNASISLSRLAAGAGGTEYKTTVEMSIFGNLVRIIACGGSADTSSLIIRSDTSIDTFRSIKITCYGNNQWVVVPLAAGGRVVIYGRK